MAEEGGPKAIPGGTRGAVDSATLVLSAKQKLYELEDQIRASGTNPARYQLMQQEIRTMYAYLPSFKTDDPRLRELWRKILGRGRVKIKKMTGMKIPIPPYPRAQVKVFGGGGVITYDLYADEGAGEVLIAQVMENDLRETIKNWREDKYNDYFYEGVNQLWEIWTDFRRWLAMLGMWSYDDVTYMVRPRVAHKDIDRDIQAREAAEARGSRRTREKSSDENYGDDDDDSGD